MLFNTNNIFCGGIDFSLPGNGGRECALFMSTQRRVFESIIGIIISFLLILFGLRRLSCPNDVPIPPRSASVKNFLLVCLTFILGIETGFKCATRSLIFLLNPCHVTTALQIYLLAAAPSPTVTKVFRVHLNFLSGALLALVFPVTNTRLLAFETEIYWIQHIAMLIVPYYLYHYGGVYTSEDLGDFNWTFMSYGFLLMYHFTVLQVIGMLTWVNLNSMVCPAVSDPFYGPNYRIAAICHQMVLVPTITKIYCLVTSYSLKGFSFTKVKDKLDSKISLGVYRNSVISCAKKSLDPLMNNDKKLE